MSWTMWHENGIGMDCSKAEPKKYRAFILNHEESLQAMQNPDNPVAMKKYSQMMDYLHYGVTEQETPDLDYLRWELTDCNSLAEPVCSILYAETGIRFAHPGYTDDGEDFVLFIASNPWGYNETELALTQESLLAALEPYAEELGVSVDKDVDLIYAG